MKALLVRTNNFYRPELLPSRIPTIPICRACTVIGRCTDVWICARRLPFLQTNTFIRSAVATAVSPVLVLPALMNTHADLGLVRLRALRSRARKAAPYQRPSGRKKCLASPGDSVIPITPQSDSSDFRLRRFKQLLLRRPSPIGANFCPHNL